MAVIRISPRVAGAQVDSSLWTTIHDELGGSARDTHGGALLFAVDGDADDAIDQLTALLHLRGVAHLYCLASAA